MLVGIVAVLTALVVVLLWQNHRKDEDLRQKNDVIIHEVAATSRSSTRPWPRASTAPPCSDCAQRETTYF